MIKKRKVTIFKKVAGIFFVIIAFLASGVAITFSSLNIASKTHLSSDFDNGVSYSLRFNLVDKDNKPLYVLNPSTHDNPYKINDEKLVLSKLDNTATIVAKQLEDLGLTNISVSSGIGSYLYHDQTANEKIIPIGYVNMNFENSPAVFGISDEKDNEFLNASKISSKIGDSNRYQFESIKSKYTGYFNNSLPSTGRDGSNNNTNSSIIANESGASEKQPYFLVSSPSNLTEKITTYKNSEGVIDSNAIQLVQENYYYIGPFIKQKFDFDDLPEAPEESTTTYADTSTGTDSGSSGSEGSEGSGSGSEGETEQKPNPREQFQTKYTWFLWKDKSGFINYLNQLVLASYYNIYANNLSSSSISNKDLYNVGTPTNDNTTNTNAIDTDLRKQINLYLDSLNELEKNIVKFFTTTGRGNPDFINENNLMGFLYEFYNSEFNTSNSVGIPNDISKPIDPNTHSNSELEGWGFLEADNSDLNELISPYLIGKYDYSNFSSFFENPNPPTEDELKEAESKHKPIYYTTHKFKLPNQESSIDDFINNISQLQYDFPILDIANDNSVEELYIANREVKKFNDEIWNGVYGQLSSEIFKDNKDYQKKLKEIANNFSLQKIFGDVAATKPRYENPAFYNFPIFNIFLISLSAIILIVGIIVSILYRIPGFFSFLFSALTFTGSIAFFNLFGFTFSFFSFIGLLFGTALSFLTPFFVFRNFKKEIKEGSSIYGAFVKTMKKYWKLSLDIHVVSILASFSFLFFGSNQIVDFGAVLTISSFLSLVLSGVAFFLCISIIITLFKYLSPKFFMTKYQGLIMKMSSQSFGDSSLTKLNLNNKKESWILSKIKWSNFYSKMWIISLMSIVFVSFIGLILLFVLGPGYSIDFSGGYILKIFNYDKFSNLINNNFGSIPGYIGNGAYIFDNVLYIPSNGIDNIAVLKWINGLTTDPSTKNILINSYSIVESNNSISLELVRNAWACFGISLGFISCWVLISINWVYIIPFVAVQLSSIVLFMGWIGITRFELNIESISVVLLLYLTSIVYSVGLLSSIKISWDRSKPLSFDELKLLTNSIVLKVNNNFIFMIYILIGFAIVITVATLNKLLFLAFITMIIGLIVLIFFVPRILLQAWILSIKLKNIYVKEISNSAFNKTRVKIKNYDDIDEQLVKGLNYK